MPAYSAISPAVRSPPHKSVKMRRPVGSANAWDASCMLRRHLAILAFTRCGIVKHFHKLLGRGINEPFAGGLEVALRSIYPRAISPALKKQGTHQDETIDRQIHNQKDAGMD